MLKRRSKIYYLNKLGLSIDADENQIRTAYRRLAKKVHPDINPTKEAHFAFVEINEAYSQLINWHQIKTPPNVNVDYGEYNLRKERTRFKNEAREKAKRANKRYINTQIRINATISPLIYLGILFNTLILFDFLLPTLKSDATVSKIISFNKEDMLNREQPSSDSFVYVYFASLRATLEFNDLDKLDIYPSQVLSIEKTRLFGVIRTINSPQLTKGKAESVLYYYSKYFFLNMLILILGIIYIRISIKSSYKLHAGIGLLLWIFVQIIAIIELYTF